MLGLKLSIIVPVYRVENYLPKCIDSLLNQDVAADDYEIILVDDGSPDHCGEICDKYAANHTNVKVLHRENGGLSVARNSGMDAAQGKYIQFVDSDDYLEPNVLKALVEKMESDWLDVLRFNYRNVNESGEVIEPNKDPKRWVSYSSEVCDGLTFLNERLGPACYACQFMIRREVVNDCRFKEGIYFEDTEWAPRMLMKAGRASSTDLMVYNYFVREGSITQSVDEKKKRKVLDDKLLLIDSLKSQMQEAGDRRWFEGMIAMTTISILGYVCQNYYSQRKTIIKALKTKDVFPLSTYNSNENAIRKIKLANLSPGLLCWMLHRKASNTI